MLLNKLFKTFWSANSSTSGGKVVRIIEVVSQSRETSPGLIIKRQEIRWKGEGWVQLKDGKTTAKKIKTIKSRHHSQAKNSICTRE